MSTICLRANSVSSLWLTPTLAQGLIYLSDSGDRVTGWLQIVDIVTLHKSMHDLTLLNIVNMISIKIKLTRKWLIKRFLSQNEAVLNRPFDKPVGY